MEIPSLHQQHPLEASRKMLKKGIAVPYALPLPTEETNWKVGYKSPSDIFLVGSWPNKMSVKPKDGLRYGVDLAVEMPDVSVVPWSITLGAEKNTTIFRVYFRRRIISMDAFFTNVPSTYLLLLLPLSPRRRS